MGYKNEYLEYLVLQAKYGDRGYDLVDHAIEKGEVVEVRNMCAKVHPVLIERLEDVCKMLDVSKRRFIESAVSAAVHEAEQLIGEHFPHLEGWGDEA